MKKTTSVLPLVLGIIGGVLGIIGGSCLTFLAEAANAVEESVIDDSVIIGGYLVLASSIFGLVCGCIAKKTAFGSLGLTLAAVLLLVGIIVSTAWGIIQIAALVLFVIGGIMGLANPVKEEVKVEAQDM